MNSFLKNIAQNLYSRYGEDISNLCLVFPNRRAGLYFKKYLSELTQKPIWSPDSITINELTQEISGLQIADNIKLLFELYNIYKPIKKSAESFDDFYFWGEMMLNDFDDIDKYLIDPEDLFKNLKSLKSIQDQFSYLTPEQVEAIQQFWQSFDPEKHSVHQEEFISIWNILLDIYKQFNKKLEELGLAYEGMIYRKVAEKLKDNSKITLHRSKYIFIGFNALNNCEKKLFNYLQNNKLADFYWDYDEIYINNENHEAGLFLRQNIKDYKAPESFNQLEKFDSFLNQKNIEILSVPSDIGQAKVISEKLKNHTNTDSPKKAAIVLADEDLLVPILHSVPDNIDKVNITMGYPVSNTPIYSLLEHVIDLQKNAKPSKSGVNFYHKNVVAILSHQYVNTLQKEQSEKLLQYIRRNNKIVISKDELNTCDFFNSIFYKVNTYQDFSEYLLNILYEVYNSLNTEKKENTIHTSSLEKEYIYHIYLSINRVKDVLAEQKVEIKIDTFIRLIRKIVNNLRVPFTGEPLTGLQIMGILETRLLDFENLIITSLNEGTLPKTEAALSFIPYNLRHGFGLPTIEFQDSIYAYYFYRLIQRAKNITLVYNSSNDGMQTGEMSRFLYQLIYESDFNITQKSLRYDINIEQAEDIRIEKTDEVLQKLDKYFPSKGGLKYLSPSALNTYMRCSLQFYFRYIAELRELDEITEEIDAPLFGNIVHESMDFLYQNFVNKQVSTTDLEALLKSKPKIRSAIDHAFKKEYFKSDKAEYSGKNIIIRDIIENYVNQIIKIDKNIAPFEIVSLEDTYELEIPITTNGTFDTIKLGGKIDRVDKLKNTIRIIDYKTGGDKLEFKNIESLFSEKKNERKDAVFQTLLYAKFYKELKKPGLNITPGVYSVRKIFDNNFDPRILWKDEKRYIDNYDEVYEEYNQNLSELINSIFDKTADFSQTEEIDSCKYCEFKKICNR